MTEKRIKGTKLLPSRELLISSGNSSVDRAIGEGIQVGSIFLVEEDFNGSYAKTLLKYFLAEGILRHHCVLFASKDSDSDKFIKDSESFTNIDVPKNVQSSYHENMSIAWRYENNAYVDSTLEINRRLDNDFDTECNIDTNDSEKSSVNVWGSISQSSMDEASTYNELLHYIRDQISSNKLYNSNTRHNVLRIGIEALGSPFWQNSASNYVEPSKEAFYLCNFLLHLKILLRSACAVAFVTIPTHMFELAGTVHRIRSLVDVSVKLDAFAGTPREHYSALKDYRGLFCINKLAAISSLVGVEPGTYDLAFKMRGKRFVIEKLHLPPELQESLEREQDDSMSMGCGSSRNIALDF